LHSLHHYVPSIKLFGTTDNYNTETFKRFHINFAKEGWRASNKRDAFPQMIKWLSRREKISLFDNYLDRMDSNSNNSDPQPVPFTSPRPQLIGKHPPYPQRQLSIIQDKHNAPHFSQHLKEFLNSFLHNPTTNQRAQFYTLPFDCLDVWTQFKFQPHNLQDNSDIDSEEKDTVKSIPKNSPHQPNGQFDTVVALRSNEAESTGVEGMSHNINFTLSEPLP
jgi:hypothetical protein